MDVSLNKPYGIIYLATNRVNGKKYVGQTVDTLSRRWTGHVSKSGKATLRREQRQRLQAAKTGKPAHGYHWSNDTLANQPLTYSSP